MLREWDGNSIVNLKWSTAARTNTKRTTEICLRRRMIMLRCLPNCQPDFLLIKTCSGVTARSYPQAENVNCKYDAYNFHRANVTINQLIEFSKSCLVHHVYTVTSFNWNINPWTSFHQLNNLKWLKAFSATRIAVLSGLLILILSQLSNKGNRNRTKIAFASRVESAIREDYDDEKNHPPIANINPVIIPGGIAILNNHLPIKGFLNCLQYALPTQIQNTLWKRKSNIFSKSFCSCA